MTREQTIESATKWMEDTAADNSHGYSQTNRWGPDYDCSSAVISAWQQAGVEVKTKGATYTGNMYGVFIKCGFVDVTKKVNLKTGSGLKRGDVLLNRRHHTAMYCGDGREVEASINELGKAVGGKTGDQTGKEFLVRSYRNYPWTDVLRYAANEDKSTVRTPNKNGVLYKENAAKNGAQYKIVATTLMLRTDASTSAKIIKVLHKNDTVIWYGYYKFYRGDLWLLVATGNGNGWCCTGENGKSYMEVTK